MLLGFILRNVRLPRIPASAMSVIVWGLLFFFGIEIGSDNHIVGNFGFFGVKSIILAVAGIAGSIAMAWLTGYLFNRKGRKE